MDNNQNYSIRTDLAIETREIYKKAQKIDDEVPGVETVVDDNDKDIVVTRVKITSDEGEKALGKVMGSYITFEIPRLKNEEEELNKKVEEKISNVIKELSNLNKDDTVLVVGLGNAAITADALGPKVVEGLEVTRHLLKYVPQYVAPGTRGVCAVAPGVLGTTGIETEEIVMGIIEKVKPNLVIIIDALASRKMERVSTTIQITDTGIVPGSGVGNHRNALTKETLGVPVIAVGIPTVVDAATIANDTIELLLEKLEKNDLYKNISQSIENTDKYQYIKEVLSPSELNYIVTPKEIDDIIENVSELVSNSINMALN